MAAYAALVSLSQTTDLTLNQGKFHFPINVKEEIRSIHAFVVFLLSFFDDFPEKSNRWEGKIRDVAHKIEDIIENFMWQQIQSSYREMNLSNVGLKAQLKNATEEIGLIAGEMMEERPADSPAAAAAIPSSSKFAPTGNGKVIGLDDDIMAIMERLCGEPADLQVIPIVGMGGIGKTTLARTVYDSPLISEYFDICAWVVVSQDYNPTRFRNTLLDSMKLYGKEMSRRRTVESEMAIEIFQNLKNRRYLIVMDDVWGKDVWDDVMNIFPDDGNGSRIMLTARLLDVAAYPGKDNPLHEMRFMDDDQSWNLLREKVFADSKCPPHLIGVGKKIAQRCAGLPLTLVLLAGLLSAANESRVSWNEMARNVNLVVDRGLEEILALSYTSLPHHLRPCFLFIGGFPEDANICASRLIRLWVAAGFLKQQGRCNKTLEEEANDYLEDLVKRNLVIVSSRKSNGEIKCCNLHDLVRNLCIRKAHEENFFYVVDGRGLPQGMINYRHMSINCSDIKNIWGPTIRTALFFKQLNNRRWLASSGQLRLLRVFDAEVCGFEEFTSPILELFHLRYLALFSFKIPSAISNLMNLQTLVIIGNYGSHLSLPLEIWRMRQLRHLVCDAPYMLPHPPNGSNLPLENLQTLWPVKDLVWNEKMVQMIPNIKKLGLVYSMNQDYHLHHLKDLQLGKLKIKGHQGFSWRLQNPIFPRTLIKLTLEGGQFASEDVCMIGSLPNLQVLKLLDHAYDDETWSTADGKFPELQVLIIEQSSVLQWIAQSSPVPRLKRLMLRDCKRLKRIPQGLGEIMTLELIEVNNCRESLKEFFKQIKQDQESYGNNALQIVVIDKYNNKSYKTII